MPIHEMESVLEVGDNIDCPFGNCHDICSKGLDVEACEESYEEWLAEQIAEMED